MEEEAGNVIDRHYIFQRLILFFSLDAAEQQTLIYDFDEERRFDLGEGDVYTKYPLFVLSLNLEYYAKDLKWEAGCDEFEYLDASLCEEIYELMCLINAQHVSVECLDTYYRTEKLSSTIWVTG